MFLAKILVISLKLTITNSWNSLPLKREFCFYERMKEYVAKYGPPAKCSSLIYVFSLFGLLLELSVRLYYGLYQIVCCEF